MRSKLKLQLEDLSVDSFDTTGAQKPRGTVFGEQCTCYTQCTCPGCPTCDATCANTCANTCDDVSCNGTCNRLCGATGPLACYSNDFSMCEAVTCNGNGTCGVYPCVAH